MDCIHNILKAFASEEPVGEHDSVLLADHVWEPLIEVWVEVLFTPVGHNYRFGSKLDLCLAPVDRLETTGASAATPFDKLDFYLFPNSCGHNFSIWQQLN